MPPVTVTVREIKNKDIGLDISVPNHNEISGKMTSTIEYHVVVVTSLDCFKLPKHKETDNVQFMIKKTMGDFDDFHKKMTAAFPGTILPPLPPKTLFTSDKLARERRNALDHLLKVIHKVPKLVNHPIFLEFLGVDPMRASLHTKKDQKPVTKDQDAKEEGDTEGGNADTQQKEVKQSSLFDEDDEPEHDMFTSVPGSGDIDDDIFKSGNAFSTGPDAETKLFDDQDFGGGIAENDDLASFVIRDTDVKEKFNKADAAPAAADGDYSSDLLNIEDDLDKLLTTPIEKPTQDSKKPPLGVKPNISPKPKSSDKPTIQNKPKIGQKPVKTPNKPDIKDKPTIATKQTVVKEAPKAMKDNDSLFAPNPESSLGDMDDDDIMKYIQDNEQTLVVVVVPLELVMLVVPTLLVVLVVPIALVVLAVPLELVMLVVPILLVVLVVPIALVVLAVPLELVMLVVPILLVVLVVPIALVVLAVPLELVMLVVPIALIVLVVPIALVVLVPILLVVLVVPIALIVLVVPIALINDCACCSYTIGCACCSYSIGCACCSYSIDCACRS
ncbi:unnamed protein product [Owenia fusiformis]|uniref:Uncharacterized protein n=1 Tax=Owenia fusiformis TaxID=6347 RepID=A0A8J1UWJ5_OWEFU|nr:unnamed protein product [Owenia fusiformis]